MTTESPTGDAAADPVYEPPSLRRLLRPYRRIVAAVSALVVLAVVLTVVGVVVSAGSGGATLADASTCSQWSAAAPAQRAAYSRLYLSEQGRTGALPPSRVTSAINADCRKAAYLGESADISLIAALLHAF